MKKPFILLAILIAGLVFGIAVAEEMYANTGLGKITVNVPDADGDNCNDREEQGKDSLLGGQRDPSNPWDFYDVNSDGLIDFYDTALVAFQFGTKKGDLLYEWRPETDRANAEDTPTDFANLGPPDGVIDWADFNAVLAQRGSSCEGPGPKTIDLDAECDSIVKEMGEPEDNFELEPGETHIECFLERNPDTGEVVDVHRTVTTNMGTIFEGGGAAGGTGAIAGSSVGYYRCEAEKKYESLVFRTDLAKVKVILRWSVVLDQDNPFYAAVGLRETWKEVSAVWPWEVTDYNDVIDVVYTDPFQAYRLKARTWSGFHYEVSVFGLGVSRDMQIHVWTTAGLNTSDGVAKCWDGGYNT